MTARVPLTIDKQGRMSVGRLGLGEGFAVATELPDGSGWVIRPAELMTQAEIDVNSRQENLADLDLASADVAAGRVRPRHRSTP